MDVGMEFHPLKPIRDGELLLHILGDVDEYGAGAAGRGQEKSLANNAGNVVDVEER